MCSTGWFKQNCFRSQCWPNVGWLYQIGWISQNLQHKLLDWECPPHPWNFSEDSSCLVPPSVIYSNSGKYGFKSYYVPLWGYTGERSTVNKFRTLARILYPPTLLTICASNSKRHTLSPLVVHHAEVLQKRAVQDQRSGWAAQQQELWRDQSDWRRITQDGHPLLENRTDTTLWRFSFSWMVWNIFVICDKWWYNKSLPQKLSNKGWITWNNDQGCSSTL